MSSGSVIQISVIVAAQDAGPNLERCINALIPQIPPGEMEIIVVDGSRRKDVRARLGSNCAITILHGPSQPNVPQLWTAGIQASRGRIVALTIENCVPAADWVEQMLKAHDGTWVGVGGAIEMAPQNGLVDWAVYFSRYSNYMLPFESRFLDDVAGDNCSYKREALEPVRSLANGGFWETFVHEDMRRRGERLLSAPAPVVIYFGGLTGFRFLRRRFIHGRYFAARRSREFTGPQRIMRAAGSFLVPLLLVRRIAARVWRNGRHRMKFLMTFPVIAAFVVAWAAGEGVGYLEGPSRARVPTRD